MYHYIANATGCLKNDFECVRSADVDILKQASYNVFEVGPAQALGSIIPLNVYGPILRFRSNFKVTTNTQLLSDLHFRSMIHSYLSPLN